MPHRHRIGLTTLAVGLIACQGSSPPPTGALPPAAEAIPPTNLLRLARRGGTPRLYAGKTLAPLPWGWRGRLPAMELAVGFDPDQGLVYVVDSGGSLLALDLAVGTARPLMPAVRGAVLGPEGTLWTVDGKNHVGRVRHRLVTATGAILPHRPAALYGTGDGELIVVEGGDSAKALLVSDADIGGTEKLPSARTAASPFGELLAASAPTGVYLWAPHGGSAPARRLRVSGTPTAVRFSASGHRIYVARERHDIEVIERYSGAQLGSVSLPGSANALRVAPFGGWLLARAAVGDTVWFVNLTTNAYAGALAAPWGADLPTVIGDATLLLREGQDVVARDLTREGFPETGRLKGAAGDLFLPLPWSPGRNQPELAAARPDTTRAATTAEDTGARGGTPALASLTLYLQVSRSQNPAWAHALADEIRTDGFPALVLTPRPGEEAYRVVVGPYPNREAAESAGRRLGRPSFIIQPSSPRETPP